MAAAALAPCLAPRPPRIVSSLSPEHQHPHRHAWNSLRQDPRNVPLWGTSNRDVGIIGNTGVSCTTNNDSVTSYGNVILFDEEARKLEEFIANAKDKLVVLDISTKTCGPCKFIFPKLVKMSREYPDAVFLKINGDYSSETRALMRKWKIRQVPTFRFYRNGEMVHSHSGAKEDDLRAHFLVHYTRTISVNTS